MTAFITENRPVASALVAAAAIIATAWFANGSEYEDAWLYVFCLWLILHSGYEAYAQWKKNKGD